MEKSMRQQALIQLRQSLRFEFSAEQQMDICCEHIVPTHVRYAARKKPTDGKAEEAKLCCLSFVSVNMRGS